MGIKKKIIDGIKNIDKVAEGFYYYNNESKQREEMARKRLDICKGCPFFKDEIDVEPIAFYRLNLTDRIEGLENKVCSDCGCNLNYKLRVKNIDKSKKCKL